MQGETQTNIPITAYNIMYTDSITGSSCGSATIPASSCVTGTCRHEFEVSSSSCPPSSSINITVFPDGTFGSGLSSYPIMIGKYDPCIYYFIM